MTFRNGEAPVLIAGGGIAGLATAIALRRLGLPVRVYERAADLREVGAGVVLSPGGIVALRKLGVGRDVQQHASGIEAHVSRSRSGARLNEVPIRELARMHGLPPPVAVRRQDLLRSLAACLDPGVIQVGAEVSSFSQDNAGVTVRLKSGAHELGTVLVAADGINSTVRAGLFPTATPRYLGYQSLRALVDAEAVSIPTRSLQISHSRGDRFGIVHCGPKWIWWFGVIVTSEGTTDSPDGRKKDTLQRFRRFHQPIRETIARTPETAILRHDVRDIDLLPSWTRGRVILVGDAAHAASVAGGQGVSQALVDAALLGSCLSVLADGAGHHCDVVAAALAHFEQRRLGRATAVQQRARRAGRILSWQHPVACGYRNAVMRAAGRRRMIQALEREFASVRSELP